MLPSSVRRPATHGDVFGLGSAPSMWQAGLPSRADWVSLPGVRSMRLLHAASSSDGCWVRGPSTSPLARIRLPFRRAGRWHLSGGRECAEECKWSWWAPTMVGVRVVPRSSTDGFGRLLWSSSLVSGAEGSSADDRGWSRVLLFTNGGLGG
jgi:hypothetical protein